MSLTQSICNICKKTISKNDVAGHNYTYHGQLSDGSIAKNYNTEAGAWECPHCNKLVYGTRQSLYYHIKNTCKRQTDIESKPEKKESIREEPDITFKGMENIEYRGIELEDMSDTDDEEVSQVGFYRTEIEDDVKTVKAKQLSDSRDVNYNFGLQLESLKQTTNMICQSQKKLREELMRNNYQLIWFNTNGILTPHFRVFAVNK